jgi:non-ribosomal peptide synthetase-like protein
VGVPPFQLRVAASGANEPGPPNTRILLYRIFAETSRTFIVSAYGLLLVMTCSALFNVTFNVIDNVPERTEIPLGRIICYSIFILLATCATSFCFLVIFKHILRGRVEEADHAFWSVSVFNWSLAFVVSSIVAAFPLACFQGTPIVQAFFRAMGVKIGEDVYIDSAIVVFADPDSLHFGSGGTIHNVFQSHTFEDRLLKIRKTIIGEHTTLSPHACIMASEVGKKSRVFSRSVVLKGEVLGGGMEYIGNPVLDSQV